MAHRPGLLIVLDGFAWGDPHHPCNAVALARTPFLDRLREECPHVEVMNHEHHVGLPPGQMGNSEVGHMCIGAGRVLYQDFLRINKAIEDGSHVEAYQHAIEYVGRTGGRIHLMGLLGPGGVHAHESHFGAALRGLAAAGVGQVFVHPIGDGRDTLPRSAKEFGATLTKQIASAGVGRIGSFVGRYYAMDRDKRWERTQAAYDLYTKGQGRVAESLDDAIEQAYDLDEDDEFVRPTLIDGDAVIRSGDAVLFLNFRPDRARQITRAFMDAEFSGFKRERLDLHWTCTTQYDDAFAGWANVHIAYPPHRPTGTLGQLIQDAGLRQLRVAETEKYAHVTFFMSGGREQPFEGEDRILIPSPNVATYDLQPEMSAHEITDALLQAIGSGEQDLIIVNYANGDMVGHTGNLQAGIRAVETLDDCLSRVITTATACGFVTVLTSDHGNCEEMCEVCHDGSAGQRLTNHSLLPSPLLVAGAPEIRLRNGGSLAHVAPTILDLMGLPRGEGMLESLVERSQ